MTVADRAVLVTAANRGIGQALVEEALRRDAKRVYGGTRQPLADSESAGCAADAGRDQRGADSGSGRERRVARHPHQQRRHRPSW
jgi:NAD(P)-dependent dehydrogenase (short-subunit alcohol dehydrogenase family)